MRADRDAGNPSLRSGMPSLLSPAAKGTNFKSLLSLSDNNSFSCRFLIQNQQSIFSAKLQLWMLNIPLIGFSLWWVPMKPHQHWSPLKLHPKGSYNEATACVWVWMALWVFLFLALESGWWTLWENCLTFHHILHCVNSIIRVLHTVYPMSYEYGNPHSERSPGQCCISHCWADSGLYNRENWMSENPNRDSLMRDPVADEIQATLTQGIPGFGLSVHIALLNSSQPKNTLCVCKIFCGGIPLTQIINPVPESQTYLLSCLEKNVTLLKQEHFTLKTAYIIYQRPEQSLRPPCNKAEEFDPRNDSVSNSLRSLQF